MMANISGWQLTAGNYGKSGLAMVDPVAFTTARP